MKIIKSLGNSVVNAVGLIDITVDHTKGIVDKSGQIVNNSLEVSVVESEQDLVEALAELGVTRKSARLEQYEQLEAQAS